MRLSVILVALITGLAISASAQKPLKTKTKPTHSEERESGKTTARSGRQPVARNSAEQELKRVEQSSSKVSGASRNQSAKTARNNPVLKAQKKEANPPIRPTASGGAGKSAGKQGDGLKGRLRHKGRH
jgi:hypothetical protein